MVCTGEYALMTPRSPHRATRGASSLRRAAAVVPGSTASAAGVRRAKTSAVPRCRRTRTVLRAGEFCSVRLPDRTIVVSKALRDHFLREHGRDTVYIPNGITPPVYREPALIRQRGIDDDFILFVGRLVPEKGCHLLLEAYGRLPAKMRERHRLVIAGDAGFTAGYVEELRASAPAETLASGLVVPVVRLANPGNVVTPAVCRFRVGSGASMVHAESVSVALPVNADTAVGFSAWLAMRSVS